MNSKLILENTSAQISIPHHDSMLATFHTVYARVILNGTPTDFSGILDKYGNYVLGVDELRRILAGYLNTSFDDQVIVGNESMEIGKQHSLAYTFDEAGQKVYLDGELDNSTTPTGDPLQSNEPMQIGESSLFTLPSIVGEIDVIFIFDRGLDEEEIKMLDKNVIPHGLICGFLMNEGYGDDIHDFSPAKSSSTSSLNISWAIYPKDEYLYSITFDGDNSYVDLGDTIDVQNVDFWMKCDTTDNQVIIGGVRDGDSLCIYDDRVNLYGELEASTSTTEELCDGEWHYVEVIYEPPLRLYIDGEQKDLYLPMTGIDSDDLTLGARIDRGSYTMHYEGSLMDVNISTHGEYLCYQNRNEKLIDISGNDNHGDIVHCGYGIEHKRAVREVF